MARAKKGEKLFILLCHHDPLDVTGQYISVHEKKEKSGNMSLVGNYAPMLELLCCVQCIYMYSVCFLISHESDHIFSLTIMIFNPSFVVLSWAYRYMCVYADTAASSRHAPYSTGPLLHRHQRTSAFLRKDNILSFWGSVFYTHTL